MRLGFATSLARPGQNITGLTSNLSDLASKHIQMLTEIGWDMTNLGILWDPRNTGHAVVLDSLKEAALKAGLRPITVELSAETELSYAFASLARAQAKALLILVDPFFALHARKLAELAIEQRWSRFAEQNGGLAKVDSGFDYAASFSSFACLDAAPSAATRTTASPGIA